MIQMKEVDKIKHLRNKQHLSFRQIAELTGHHRATVMKWYQTKEFPEYKRKQGISPVKDQILPFIKQWINEDVQLIKKGRRKRIRPASTMWADLEQLGIYCGKSTVRQYLSELKPNEVSIPLCHEPGEEIQVDWGELKIAFVEDRLIKVNLFVATLPFSNARFVYPYFRADTMSFFDGHVKAFNFFGGVSKRITYDNLTIAIKKVLFSTDREEQAQMIHFKNYYGFETNYCNVAKANEKGSVENAVGFGKRRYLDPSCIFSDFEQLRTYLVERAHHELTMIHYKKRIKTETLLKQEQTHLMQVPENPYDCSQIVSTKSNKSLLVDYDGVSYSVPSDYCLQPITLKATPEHIVLSKGEKILAYHKRVHKHLTKEVIDFRHYLPALYQKPRALDQATCIKKAEFPPIFWTYLHQLQQKQQDANRQMIRILQLHTIYDLKSLFYAMEYCHISKTYSYEAVCMALRQLHQNPTKPEPLTKTYSQVYVQKTDSKQYGTLMGGDYE